MQTESRGVLRRTVGGLWSLVGWLRNSLANLFFLLLLGIIVAALLAERPPAVPERAALVLALSGRVVEQTSIADPLEHLLGGGNRTDPETLLQDVLDAIAQATTDDRIPLIVLALDALDGVGITKTRDIAAALETFRAAGKKVIAIGDAYTQDQYLLAVQADEVWLHPMGYVDLSGFGMYRNYYADALAKLKVDVHVFRSGAYKSAYEFLERGNMSDADRESTGGLLQEIWRACTGMVTARRQLPPEAVDHYANAYADILARHGGDTAASALEHGLVDAVKTREEMDAALVERVGEDPEGGFSGIDFRRYLAAVRPALPQAASAGKAQVGVIVASGMILDGEQPPGTVGGDSLAALIQSATDDDDVKALVLRVDSPGGSAFASEVIRTALLAFRASGKPLVVSMGSVAASGGYWIATAADEIWASPTTLTGSIGVLGMFPSIARLLEDLGIHNDGVGTTTLAGALDVSRPLAPAMKRVLELTNENAYRKFVGIVADGRGMEPGAVEALAGGRVWSGQQAAGNGLVDHLGDLDAAVAAAAKRAKLGQWERRLIETPPDWRAQLLHSLSLARGGELPVMLRELGAAAGIEGWQALFNDPRGEYALCGACPRF